MACLRPHINTTLSVCLNTASPSCDPERPINRFLLHVGNNHFPIKYIKRSLKRNICISRQEARMEISKLTECQFKFQTLKITHPFCSICDFHDWFIKELQTLSALLQASPCFIFSELLCGWMPPHCGKSCSFVLSTRTLNVGDR